MALLAAIRGLCFQACSGPGAHRVIAENIAYAHWSALGVGLILLPIGFRYVRARCWVAAGSHGILLLLHPAWWMSATHGDCGARLQAASLIVLGITFAAWFVSPAAVRALQRGRSVRGFEVIRVTPPPPEPPEPGEPAGPVSAQGQGNRKLAAEGPHRESPHREGESGEAPAELR